MARTALLAIGVLVAVALPAAIPAATVNVQITRAGFVPSTVTVKIGDTVTWTNADTQNRQVVAQDPAATFASPVLTPGQQFSYTFTRAGRVQVEDPLVRPRDRMTVVVEAAPASVTLELRPSTVRYGGTVTLAGRISTGAAGERVTVFAQACGAQFTRVGDATTTTGGAWTLAVKPANNTSYRAQWRTATSPTLVAKVAPRLTLRRLAPKRFALRVSAAQSFAGKVAVVQRYNAVTRAWVRVRTVTLRSFGGTAPTVVTGVNFRVNVLPRRRLRAVLGQAAVGQCYVAGTSNAVLT